MEIVYIRGVKIGSVTPAEAKGFYFADTMDDYGTLIHTKKMAIRWLKTYYKSRVS